MRLKHILAIFLTLILVGCVSAAMYLFYLSSNLPQLITVNDYKPLVVSEVFDANGEKIGEFYREKRIVTSYDQIPQKLVQAFVASEDDSFFEHSGINYLAILRAAIANLKAGRKVQGGSTITQQVARSLMLSSEKTYDRKIREILLSYRMESNLSKQDIMYLYLNQIYLGEGAYGVAAAAKVYFRKDLKDLTLPEMAILAGLPQAPGRYSPLDSPSSAKARQRYVLGRMLTVGFINQKEHDQAAEMPVQVFARQNYSEIAPFFVETIRQYLVKAIGEEKVLDEGIRVETGLIKKNQIAAQAEVLKGVRDLDKRQGFRGPITNIEDVKNVADFLLKVRNRLMDDNSPELSLLPDGTLPARSPLNLNAKPEPHEKFKNLPFYLPIGTITEGIVTKVDDKWGIVTVRVAESQGLIDLDTMKWARKPNPEVPASTDELTKPSKALKAGDVIHIRVAADVFSSPRLQEKLIGLRKDFARTQKGKKFETPKELQGWENMLGLELEQEPLAQGALLAFDLKTHEIVSMVGGSQPDTLKPVPSENGITYRLVENKLNRTIQAVRQTGSSFKPIVYAAGLDNGFNPASVIIDAPIVYEDAFPPEEGMEKMEDSSGSRSWKPGNYGKTFGGDVLFRNALISSLNIPTIKVLESVGVSIAADYSRRLGIFSPINNDLSLGLGSSSVTLYEMTKVFGHFGRLGKRLSPILIRKVKDASGQVLLENASLDSRFQKEIEPIEKAFEEKRLALLAAPVPAPTIPLPAGPDGTVAPPAPKKKEARLYFSDKDQLISQQTAYLMTSLLKGVIFDPGGTGGAARAIGRPAAGKTGTTSSYYDTWFIGYTPQIVSGVWVGFDTEKSLGIGETGGKTALPIWLEYMKLAHENLPRLDFAVPDKIVFANIDNETGKLASAQTKVVVRQAFVEGTEPGATNEEAPARTGDEKDFYKEDLSN